MYQVLEFAISDFSNLKEARYWVELDQVNIERVDILNVGVVSKLLSTSGSGKEGMRLICSAEFPFMRRTDNLWNW